MCLKSFCTQSPAPHLIKELQLPHRGWDVLEEQGHHLSRVSTALCLATSACVQWIYFNMTVGMGQTTGIDFGPHSCSSCSVFCFIRLSPVISSRYCILCGLLFTYIDC